MAGVGEEGAAPLSARCLQPRRSDQSAQLLTEKSLNGRAVEQQRHRRKQRGKVTRVLLFLFLAAAPSPKASSSGLAPPRNRHSVTPIPSPRSIRTNVEARASQATPAWRRARTGELKPKPKRQRARASAASSGR
uniref:Uncharacterized protein n=1 Tax=Arundo donax TaxID=35708 RepID=A0A0A9H3L6_ARUDO